jgi:protein-disulfide isomerase
VKIARKHLPLAMHKDAPGAHLASVAAQKQGKFWEFHDLIFENQKELNIDKYREHAQVIGLDVAQFENDFQNLDNKKIVDADAAEAATLKVTGTPGFFVNGRFLSGAKPFEEFAKVINAELNRLGQPIPEEAQGL